MTRKPTVADVLMHAFTLEGAERQLVLRRAKIRFEIDGVIHQIHDYSRGAGAWVCACGVQYESNARAQASMTDAISCWGSLAADDGSV